MQQPKKTFVLTHNFDDRSLTQSEPIIMRWNGVDTPEVLRSLKPGQYAILPFEPPNEVLQSKKEAA